MCQSCGNLRNWNYVSSRCGCGCTTKKGEPGIQGLRGFTGASVSSSSLKGIVAYAAGGQGAATMLTTVLNRVDSVPTVNASVVCYKALGSLNQEVTNNDTTTNNTMAVYPAFGNNFLGQSTNDPIYLPSGSTLKVFCYEGEDGVWTIIP